MSFLADKKREHEAAAEKALADRDYAKAFFHTAKAAEFGFSLAEQVEGKVARSYVDDANELLEIAAALKEKAARQQPAAPQKALRETGDEDTAKTQWELKDKPSEKLADVAGLDAVKQELREKVIEPFTHPELYERFKVKVGGGILMYGPPGNGKTFVARAIAGELDAAFFNVNASQIKDKYVGETEKNMQRLFEEARQHDRAVLFLDEVDHLLAKRGNRKVGTVAQFLALTDGLVKNTNCMLVLAATNKPWILDEAVIRPGRLGTHIYVGPPDAPARQAIIAYSLKDTPVADDLSSENLAARTDGYSGADIAELCDRAKRSALARQLAAGTEEQITNADFDAALQKVRPSVTPAMLKEFEAWRDTRRGPADAALDDD
ncbi:MAG: ATP-dependent zinc metalloprotease FtsH [Candidatus Hydrogenedentes bacterium ADurb.Bin179]|nr:MAG: ATP-dependent zinc metalloprotease FtsH [Candidatus Hydrogenedentes bacterium ADurb.Bin179]